MAEGPDPFTKLKEQVTCPVCLDVFIQPKLLACTHAFCMDCIDCLPVDLVDGAHKIRCPTCREPTTLPCNDSAASLRPAFHINTLMELHHIAVKLPVAVTDKPKDSKCFKHDRPLEMYCDDCKRVLCAKCAHADHRNHYCDYISDVFHKHQQEIYNHLQPVKQQLSLVLDALHDLDTQQEHIATQAESVKNQIDALIDQLVQAICQSGATLKQNVDTLVQNKLNKISQKKEEGVSFHVSLKSCEQYVQDKLSNGSQQEILMDKDEMIKRLKTVSQQLALQQLQLEKADIVFEHGHDVIEMCSKIGEVSIDSNTTTPNSCIVHDISSTTEATLPANSSQRTPLLNLTNSAVAIVGRASNIDISVPSVSRLDRFRLSCHLVADVGGVSTQCEIKHVEKKKHRISFTPTCQGLHYIRVHAKEKDIHCQPCAVQVATTRAIHHPTAITTAKGLLVVAEYASIAVIDKEGRIISKPKIQRGSVCNSSICVSPDKCILVLSAVPARITKYTMDCTLVSIVSLGSGPLQFKWPQGIAASTSGHIYVCDTSNHRIQVLNPDLTFSHMFGERGSGPGQVSSPRGIAIDAQDTIYVCDFDAYQIKKFSSNGTYISKFEVPSRPHNIAIDYNTLYITTNDTIMVYTTDGKAINEGFTLGGDYQGVAVDEEHVYVCDYKNDQIIIF